MWQRIQTLYLAISTVLIAVLLFGDAYTFNGPDGLEALPYLKLQKPYFGILLGILAARGCYQDQVMVESAYRIRESRKRKKK